MKIQFLCVLEGTFERFDKENLIYKAIFLAHALVFVNYFALEQVLPTLAPIQNCKITTELTEKFT